MYILTLPVMVQKVHPNRKCEISQNRQSEGRKCHDKSETNTNHPGYVLSRTH